MTGSEAVITLMPKGGGSRPFGGEEREVGRQAGGGGGDVLRRAVKYMHTVYITARVVA